MIELEEMNRKQKKQYNKLVRHYPDVILEAFNEVNEASTESIKETPCGEAYYSVVRKAAQLLKELKPEDAVEASKMFDYLLWNGYFSQNKNFAYSISDRVNNPQLLGADVMRGKSVCLNNAAMLAQVLREYGTDAYLLGANVEHVHAVPSGDVELDGNLGRTVIKPKFKDIVKSGLLRLTPLRMMGNHAITAIKEDDRYFISDPTNQVVGNFTDLLKVQNTTGEIDMTIKPWLTVVMDRIKPEDFHDLIDRSFMYSDEDVVTSRREMRSMINANMKCMLQRNLLDDFYDDAKENIDTVSKTLVKQLITKEDIQRKQNYKISR